MDEKGEMKTSTIDFSLSVDLRKTPELLCKSKDRVPLFKLTASGSYNCTRNAFRRAGFKQTKGNNFTVLWGMALKMPELKELKEFQVTAFGGTLRAGGGRGMALQHRGDQQSARARASERERGRGRCASAVLNACAQLMACAHLMTYFYACLGAYACAGVCWCQCVCVRARFLALM